jgi:hypothetical protein
MTEHRSNDKKQRKSITLEEELDVIRRYDHNECIIHIANAAVVYKRGKIILYFFTLILIM